MFGKAVSRWSLLFWNEAMRLLFKGYCLLLWFCSSLSFTLIHSLTHSLPHSLTHSLPHSLTPKRTKITLDGTSSFLHQRLQGHIHNHTKALFVLTLSTLLHPTGFSTVIHVPDLV